MSSYINKPNYEKMMFFHAKKVPINIPMSGLSEVIGMIAETEFRKMVSESRIVTPVGKKRIASCSVRRF